MLLSVGIRLLVFHDLPENEIELAQHCLEQFVCTAKDTYGPTFIVYNVHSLLHISSDYRSFGSLDSFSSFPFESFLSRVIKMVRYGRFPIQQISNRIAEIFPSLELEVFSDRLPFSPY